MNRKILIASAAFASLSLAFASPALAKHDDPAGHMDRGHDVNDPDHVAGGHDVNDPAHTPGAHDVNDPNDTPGAHDVNDPDHMPGAHDVNEPAEPEPNDVAPHM